MVGLLLTCAYNFKYCHSTSSVLWMYSFLKTFHFEIMVGSSAIVRNNTERSRLLFSSFSPLVSLAEPKCRNDCIQGTDIGLDTSAPPESRLTTCANIHTCMCVCVCGRVLSHISHVQLFATPQTVAHQAPLSMGFPRQEYWSGLPFPTPGDLPIPGVEPPPLEYPALAGQILYH